MASQTNIIIWVSLCIAQLIYVVVAHLRPLPPNSSDVAQTMFPILLVISMATAAGTIWWRGRALVRPIQSGALDLTRTQDLAKAFTAFILNLVLSESVAIYGLVLTFLSNDTRYVIGFVAFGLVLLWIHRPFAPELRPPSGPLGPGSRPPPIA